MKSGDLDMMFNISNNANTPIVDGATSGLGIIMIIFLLFLLSIYFLPILVIIFKKSKHSVAVILLNIFLGGTFFGWIIALILSLQSKDNIVYIYNNVGLNNIDKIP